MCLSIAVHRPGDVLAVGEHAGFEWNVVHNGRGSRCGYVKVTPGHPWFGRNYDEIDADVHGGLTFSEPDKPCAAGGPDDGYWFGFDCAHHNDAEDPSLPVEEEYRRIRDDLNRRFPIRDRTVRTQEYVEQECRSLCEQAAKAAQR